MKKAIFLMSILMASVVLTSCKPSNIKANTEPAQEQTSPGETFKFRKETETYTVPEELRGKEGIGPGWTEIDEKEVYAYYPESKRPKDVETEENERTLLCVSVIQNSSVVQIFDLAKECDADSLMNSLKENGVLKDTVELVSYETEGSKGILKLNKFEKGYTSEKEDKVIACIVNTFIDNLAIETIQISDAEKDFGERGYSYEYK